MPPVPPTTNGPVGQTFTNQPANRPTPTNAQSTQDPNNPDAKKKKGFFGKIAGIFKDDKPSTPPPQPAAPQPAPQ